MGAAIKTEVLKARIKKDGRPVYKIANDEIKSSRGSFWKRLFL